MRATVVVIGAGHCGLAVSRRLAERSIDHVVLERGEVANSWRTERWDSLRLLTPNWMTRLPAQHYDGHDPDGFMSSADVTEFITGYAKATAAPVLSNTTVTAVSAAAGGFSVETDQGAWEARAVVLASGACNVPTVPVAAEAVPAEITQLSLMDYRRPDDVPDAGVLLVGAAASGVQIADELHRSGRPVTVAVGEHVRLPRTYRGRDILWWMDAAGILNESYREVPDITRARSLPSMQLVGSPARATMDLNALTGVGVKLVGRLGAVRDGIALLSGSLPNVCALADLKLTRLLNLIDDWAEAAGYDPDGAGERPSPTRVPDPPPLELDLRSGEIRTIVWATGYRPDFSWLELPVLDRKGGVRHDGGVVSAAPGLYVIGMPFLRRRKSSLIDGAAGDSEFIADHIRHFLAAGPAV